MEVVVARCEARQTGKPHENLIQDIPHLGRDVNREPPAYKSEANLLCGTIPLCFLRQQACR